MVSPVMLGRNLHRLHSVQIAEEQSFESIRPIIEKLLDDTDQNKQRGAAELLGGLVVGSKHWPSTAQKQLWDWFTPIISRVLGSNVKTDTLTVWSTFLEVSLMVSSMMISQTFGYSTSSRTKIHAESIP